MGLRRWSTTEDRLRTLYEPPTLQLGWAKYENVGGNVSVTATYQLRQEGVLKTLVVVPSSQLVRAATIPVLQ